jgi:cobalt-zinc-cadmium efflux system outer membrane protein
MPRSAFFVVVLAAAGSVAAQEPVPAPLTLNEALALAREASPLLSAARLRGAVDRAGVSVARERPNPEARYEHARETPHDALGLAQLLELGGKRGRRIALAEAAVRTGEAELAQAQAEVAADVREAFFALAGTQRRLLVAGELRQLAERVHSAATARYEAGDVPRLDVLQAGLALYQTQNEASALEGERTAARVDLNYRIGRDAAAPTTAQDEIGDSPLPDARLAAAAALAGNAALAVLDRQLAEAQARAALARAQRIPDPTLEGALSHGSEPEFVWGYRVAVAVSLPIFTRHTAQLRLEEATLALLRAQREALAQRIRAALAAATARASAQQQQYLRYHDEILPKSREVEAMAEESYGSGQTDLTALLQALQATRELRARSLQAAADYQTALADLQRAMTTGPK